jgi:hypothetical protein
MSPQGDIQSKQNGFRFRRNPDCVKSPLRCHPRESGDPYLANINWILAESSLRPTFVGMTKLEDWFLHSLRPLGKSGDPYPCEHKLDSRRVESSTHFRWNDKTGGLVFTQSEFFRNFRRNDDASIGVLNSRDNKMDSLAQDEHIGR